jgi:hypothetical protein
MLSNAKICRLFVNLILSPGIDLVRACFFVALLPGASILIFVIARNVPGMNQQTRNQEHTGEVRKSVKKLATSQATLIGRRKRRLLKLRTDKKPPFTLEKLDCNLPAGQRLALAGAPSRAGPLKRFSLAKSQIPTAGEKSLILVTIPSCFGRPSTKLHESSRFSG